MLKNLAKLKNFNEIIKPLLSVVVKSSKLEKMQMQSTEGSKILSLRAKSC
jgi:hypothetical protein